MNDGIHYGWLGAVVADGRVSADVRQGGVFVEGITGNHRRHPLKPGFEIVPDDEVCGWQSICACDWHGPMWTRVKKATEASQSRRRAFVPFLGDAVPSVVVEQVMAREWQTHAIPAAAISELESGYRALKLAQARIDRGVEAAREAGVSWALIAATQEISRQSAHERWHPTT